MSYYSDNDIAIIGLTCRFPGAKNADIFWRNLRDGVQSVSHFTDEQLIQAGVDPELLKDPDYVKANAMVEDADMFDAAFFGYTGREVEMIDPQQRFFLECAWEAFENAGYDITRYPGTVGVYAGAGMNTYLIHNIAPRLGQLEALDLFQLMIASDKDYIATRTSFKLNLTGPSVSIQTSCSTSLVAVHSACQSLIMGESDMALAGGVAVRPPMVNGYMFREGMIYSPEGLCRAFDIGAGGTVNGNGIGVVLLKLANQALADGDYIHAIIKGTAINNDGASKRSYSAPSSVGQSGAIRRAIERAGITADQIGYVEAHGTGTIMGDPIEIEGLRLAFRETTDKSGYCALGSVKTNVGHTDAAAGMAGLIKTVQVLKHKQIPPSLNYETPNPNIDFSATPFFVNTELREWKNGDHPRYAGVSSFGVGGTNSHAVLQEPPQMPVSGPSRAWQLMLLSAKSLVSVDNASDNLMSFLKENPETNLADAAYTLQVGRAGFEYRKMVVLPTEDEVEWLSGHATSESIAFMFTGQGSQYVNMAREVYETEPVFRQALDYCATFLEPLLKLDLRTLFYPEAGGEDEAQAKLTQTAITQPALFAIEYSLAQLWLEWGIAPDVMIGHSIGEYVAACMAGVMSLDDALTVVAHRGRLMEAQPAGSMLAITLTENEVQAILDGRNDPSLGVAVLNGENMTVVSGTNEGIDALQADLEANGTVVRRLHTSHAFHSSLMEEAVAPFVEVLKGVKLNPPQIPYVSNVTGTWITDEEATDPTYYGAHLRNAVRFSQGLGEILQNPHVILLEVGPGQTLSTLGKQHPQKLVSHVVLSSVRHPRDARSDMAFILNTVGQLWVAGAEIDWERFYQGETRQRIPLPTYAFDRQRYWLDAPMASSSPRIQQTVSPNYVGYQPADACITPLGEDTQSRPVTTAGAAPVKINGTSGMSAAEQVIASIWSQVLGVPQVAPDDNFFDLGGNSLVAASLLAQVNKATQIRVTLTEFFQKPTVGQMVGTLRKAGWTVAEPSNEAVSESEDETNSSYIVMRPGNGTRLPFFWAHGTDFANFGRFFDREQAFICMPPPGLDGKHPIYETPQEIVAYHIDQMKRIQPKGPYIIGGYCLGGHVSLSIAQKLIEGGDEVARLFLVDVIPPDYGAAKQQTRHNYVERFFYHLQHSQLPKKIIQKADETAQYHRVKIFGSEEEKLIQKLDDVQERAFEFHVPSNYPGPVSNFMCQVYWDRRPEDWEQRCAVLAPNGIDIHIFPGDHNSMMREPHVSLLGETLNQLVREAQPVTS